MSLSLPTYLLAAYAADQRLSRMVRGLCEDCYVTRDDGGAYCARHELRCDCGTSEVVFRDEPRHIDGVPDWLCHACLVKDAEYEQMFWDHIDRCSAHDAPSVREEDARHYAVEGL